MKSLVPVCSYQGGKQRVAAPIGDFIFKGKDHQYFDLCCGSGAIALELRNRGVPAGNLTLVDKSPWGLFWQSVGDGTFTIDEFKNHIRAIPKDPKLIQEYVKSLSREKVDHTTAVYIFLILQASSFGSKAIWIKKDKWQNCSFRRYWTPTLTSNRQSPVNPMMPMPETLYSRTAMIVEGMYGCHGIYGDAIDVKISVEAITFVDPPYSGTTAYGFDFDYLQLIESHPSNKFYVSEGKPLTQNAHLISHGRAKGGISGERKNINQEWLSIFH